MELTTETLPNDVTLVRLVGRMDVNGAASIDLKFNALAGAHRECQVEDVIDTITARPGMIRRAAGAAA